MPLAVLACLALGDPLPGGGASPPGGLHHGTSIHGLAGLAPDDGLLALNQPGASPIQLWDVASGKEVPLEDQIPGCGGEAPASLDAARHLAEAGTTWADLPARSGKPVASVSGAAWPGRGAASGDVI